MNWFDATGIANLAKTALKEAQKQIDKALDIKDEDHVDVNNVYSDDIMVTHRSSDKNDQFESKRGLVQRSAPSLKNEIIVNENVKFGQSALHPQLDSSIWDSFTGSFFEHPTGNIENATVTKPPVGDGSLISTPAVIRKCHKDGSEAIKIWNSASTSTSTLSSTSQMPFFRDVHNEDLESVEALDPCRPLRGLPLSDSTDSTVVNIIPLHDTKLESDVMFQSIVQLHQRIPGDHEESHVDHDSTTKSSSEHSLTILETNFNMLPITIAPVGTCLHYNLSGNTMQESDHVIAAVITNADDSTSSVSLRHEYPGMQNSIVPIDTLEADCSTIVQQQENSEEHELNRSYENVEIKTQTSDSTQSFEEISPCVNIIDGKTKSGAHRETTEIKILGKATMVEYTLIGTKESIEGMEEIESVKVSGPSSGDDDIETATSSDIEIISSPNGGDSSSTHSNGVYRASPSKDRERETIELDILLDKKHHGHMRELSASLQSGNSDELSQQPDSELLMRKLVEVSETLEQREYRLVELGRQNSELQEENAVLQSQLDIKTYRTRDGSIDPEGYTQRLSALERKFQQVIREKELFKQQLDTLRTEELQKVTREEVDKLLAERDFIIGELQKEGESLSKQVLQHSNIIKKLRIKEKDSDTLICKQRFEISELLEEADRLKKSLSAKEEVERSQIDAVHKLSSEKQKLEYDCVLLKSNLEDHAQRYESLRKSFHFARKELNEQAESYCEAQQRLMKLQGIEIEHSKAQQASELMSMQLDDLREQLRRTEYDYEQRLIRMKQEHCELLSRLEAAEMRAEEEKNAAASLTIPLMKQLESLQNTLRHKEHVWQQQEAIINQQLTDALVQSTSNDACERTQRDQIASMKNRISSLEDQLMATFFKLDKVTNDLQQKQADVDILENNLRRQVVIKEGEILVLSDRLTEKEGYIRKVEQQFADSQDCTSTIRHCSAETVSASNLDNHSFSRMTNHFNLDTSNENSMLLFTSKRDVSELSPAPSIGNISLSESLVSMPWIGAEEEMVSVDGVPTGLPPVKLLNNTSLLETLQATLKQRDGEVQQLQWEIDRFRKERHILNTEISNLTVEVDMIREKNKQNKDLEEEHMEQQKRYDALLQMYGEAVEKTEELRLDLIDVKEMYKLQIDDLLRQQREFLDSTSTSHHTVTTTFKAMGNSE